MSGNGENRTAYYHLPGLFEFYELYRRFLPLYREHPEYFYDWCEIGSIYGAPMDCLWGGGRVECGEAAPEDVLALLREYGISGRLTFSNSLLREEHLKDKRCNKLAALFAEAGSDPADVSCGLPDGPCKLPANGVIVYSDLLLGYLREHYPSLYLVSSTTKVLTEFASFREELARPEFRFVVPDFRLNKVLESLAELTPEEKGKTEFLVNECCYYGCKDRKVCYEAVSRLNLGEEGEDHSCRAPESQEGYRFSKAMQNPGFIGIEDIRKVYLPMGFTNFKIEGRGLGSALILEFILYYMTRPEYQLQVREELYLDAMLDLF